MTLENMEKHRNDLEWIKERVISIEDIFKDKEKIILDERKLELFLNGVNLKFEITDGIYKIYNNLGNFIGIGCVKETKLKRDVII